MEVDSHPFGFPTARTVRRRIITVVIKRTSEFEFLLKFQLALQVLDPFVRTAFIARKINNFFLKLQDAPVELDVVKFPN
jgi:hypothetical protein